MTKEGIFVDVSFIARLANWLRESGLVWAALIPAILALFAR